MTLALAVVATGIQRAAISPSPAHSPTPAEVKLAVLGLSILAGTLWLGRSLIVRRQLLAVSAVVVLVGVVSGAGVALALGIEGSAAYSVLLGLGVFAMAPLAQRWVAKRHVIERARTTR